MIKYIKQRLFLNEEKYRTIQEQEENELEAQRIEERNICLGWKFVGFGFFGLIAYVTFLAVLMILEDTSVLRALNTDTDIPYYTYTTIIYEPFTALILMIIGVWTGQKAIAKFFGFFKCFLHMPKRRKKMHFTEEKKNKALIKAEEMADEFDTEEAEEFAQKHKAAMWYEDFILLFKMVTDKEFNISPSAYLAIAGALAYVVLPIDVIPDFIPGVGFLDDMFVIGVVMKSIADEIERYKILLNSRVEKQ